MSPCRSPKRALQRGWLDARENPDRRMYAAWRTWRFILANLELSSIIARMFTRTIAQELTLELEHSPAAPVYLKTEPGVGYRLKLS